MKKTALFSLLTVSALLLASPALTSSSKIAEGGVSIQEQPVAI
ncbi:hypothetical protein P5630_23335 (plasmid) [Bacillus subtilis]|nr:hypothetical protein [Bacillus subtilis]MEC0314718.1 hypothetical protein [Bacillus subtilis]MEC0363947.1 hypothetical protein [Bacillus subtilis]WGD66106.1 hypothetical protein P5652_22670 [Bacillus subtilis]WGD70211.1 hypothetical protein P5630_23335 [Bacillus subtilis]